jgi:hypothetical protein
VTVTRPVESTTGDTTGLAVDLALIDFCVGFLAAGFFNEGFLAGAFLVAGFLAGDLVDDLAGDLVEAFFVGFLAGDLVAGLAVAFVVTFLAGFLVVLVDFGLVVFGLVDLVLVDAIVISFCELSVFICATSSEDRVVLRSCSHATIADSKLGSLSPR